MNAMYLRQPGDMIGCYRIHRLLGAGAEGSVYVVRDTRDGALRSLKVLRGRNMVDEARHTVAAYRRLSAVASVKRFVEWGVLTRQRSVGERAWMAFHYIQGRTLSEHIDSGRIKDPFVVLLAVCEALVPVHQLGMAIGDFDRGRNLLIERGTGLIRFCDLDAGTAGSKSPTDADDLGELLRLARRLGRCSSSQISGRFLRQIASAQSVGDAQQMLREGP